MTNTFIRILIILGTIFCWLPILFPVIFAATRFIIDQRLLFDYLLPAELFPMALLGGILLIVGAKKCRRYQKLINSCFTAALGSLILGQVYAVLSGLASGKVDPSGWPWLLVILSIVVYSVALVGLGIGGVLLINNKID